MIKIIWILLFTLTFSSGYAEIKMKIVEPLRFRNINHTELGKNQVVAISHVEIYTTNKEEDLGKRISFKFPPYINMTNRRKWIKVEKVGMDRKENFIVLERERELVKFYAILDRRELDKGEEIEIIEGEYVGQLPIVMGVYTKSLNRVELEKGEGHDATTKD
ncbi:MAG: hypothetical protein ACRCVB_03070 [Cetobacterium sp.]|uniref:hypothetical protein n=1 Tax=Cetobacterium sp. ZOR0034 TaxID=1339239 RepID=UPI0006477280|nr:hypothetical protein [Cetobacterium sp. ZOR0034]